MSSRRDGALGAAPSPRARRRAVSTETRSIAAPGIEVRGMQFSPAPGLSGSHCLCASGSSLLVAAQGGPSGAGGGTSRADFVHANLRNSALQANGGQDRLLVLRDALTLLAATQQNEATRADQ